MEKAKKSTLEEMYDILHPPEEKEVIVAACRECTLILHDISKYCPECGAITELGRATRALEKLGEGEEKVDSAGLISIGFETSPGTALDLNSTGIWQPSAMTTTGTDPLNQWAKDEDTKITWEAYLSDQI